MKAFTKLLTTEEARQTFARAFSPQPLGVERVALLQARDRVLAQEIRAAADLPPFDRSTVDGYAVRAGDTAGASSGDPVSLTLAGEVFMGEDVTFGIGAGQAVRIPTGGVLPPGADAVVMQEYTVRRDSVVSIERPVEAGENFVRRGDDVKAGEVILQPGRRLRPQDLGLLAGLNIPQVDVYVQPKVAIIVTGDELVPPGQPARRGQIYDMNTFTLSGLIEESGGVPQTYGIVRDNLAVLAERARFAHQTSDVLILTGGSSVGEKDIVTDAIAALGEPGIIVHGIAIRPGKPTILAVANRKPVFGLPGNVVSAMVIYDLFVRPVIEALAGAQEQRRFGRTVRARLAGRLSAREREDHIRVALSERDDGLWATPIPGGSAVITSMTRADGIVVVLRDTALDEGAEVEVKLLA